MKKNKTQLGQALISSLNTSISHERGKVRLKSVERELASPAPEFTKKQIRNLRVDVLQLTQLEFASLLNVDLGTVRHWEQGLRKPSKSAYRLLQIVFTRPEIVRDLIGA
jgi:putative transcriptional regulator